MPVPPPKSEGKSLEPVVGYVFSTGLTYLLVELDIDLLVSTYQAQRILLFSARGDRMNMLMRVFESPKGLALDASGAYLAMGGRRELLLFRDGGRFPSIQGDQSRVQHTFVPRRSYITSDVAVHEVGWHNGELVFVATRFSCLARLDEDFSFVPVWQPPFITKIAPEDRCHLNGIATEGGVIRCVSSVATSDKPNGWRDKKRSGGVILDFPSGEIIASGLAMPHSPRRYRQQLWVLNSGTGELVLIDEKTGKSTVVAKLPGFLRGLTFVGDYAFVGLCKARESKVFGELPITANCNELECAIHVVDINTGQTHGFIQFNKGIEELFDIITLPGSGKFDILGFEEETINGVYLC